MVLVSRDVSVIMLLWAIFSNSTTFLTKTTAAQKQLPRKNNCRVKTTAAQKQLPRTTVVVLYTTTVVLAATI